MKEEKKYIDQLFNETLNNRSFDIPETFMNDLNKRLDAIEKKKKRGFFWWFILLICTTGFSFITVLLLQQPTVKPGIFQLANTCATVVNTTKKQNDNIRLSQQQQITEQVIKEINPIGIMKNISETTSNNLQSPGKHNSETINKKAGETGVTGRTNKKANRSSDGDHTKSSPEQPITEKETTNKGTSTMTDNPVIADNTSSKSSTPDAQNTEAHDSLLDDLPEKGSPDTIPTEATTDSPTEEAITSTINNTLEPALSKAKDKQTTDYWKKEIQLYGGIGTLFYIDRSDTSGYFKQLQEKQSSVIVPDIGFNGHFSYKNTTFGLGINYNQTGERYSTLINEKFLKDSIDYYTTYDTIYYYDSINDTWEVQEIIEVTEQYITQYEDSILKIITVKNVYSWVSVPLYFGYRFRVGTFEFIPRVGVQLNFGVGKRVGDYPDFASQSIAPFRSKVFSLSYLIQLEIRRNFRDHWHVFINPHFKSALTPVIHTPAFNRKYSSLGIQFGIGYTF